MNKLLITLIISVACFNINTAQQNHKIELDTTLMQPLKIKELKLSRKKLFGIKRLTDYNRLFTQRRTSQFASIRSKQDDMPVYQPRGKHFMRLYEIDDAEKHSLIIVKPE